MGADPDRLRHLAFGIRDVAIITGVLDPAVLHLATAENLAFLDHFQR